MTDQPFITGLQALYDAHSLPDGVTRVSLTQPDWNGGKLIAYVHVGEVCGHGATVADALADAMAAKAKSDAITRADLVAKANALLVQAGREPVSMDVAA